MSSVGKISVSLRGKALAPSQGGQLARNIRENIEDYRENADLAEAAGYGMVYYTPKVKEMDDVFPMSSGGKGLRQSSSAVLFVYMFGIMPWEEYKRWDTERGLRIQGSMPLREDYRQRIVERMEGDMGFNSAVEETLREGRGDDESDNALREYTSYANMLYIGKLWEEDASKIKWGEDPSSYLEGLVREKAPGVIEVRNALRAAAESIYEAIGWMYSDPENCRKNLLAASGELRKIADGLEDMDYLEVDYSDMSF